MTQRERVLDWVNRQRINAGAKPLKRLPRGDVQSAFSCPLANGLPGTVDIDENDWVRYDGEGDRHPGRVPKYVGEFIKAFDNGRYPDLVKKS